MRSPLTETEGWNVGTLERGADLPTFQLSIDALGRSGAENMAFDRGLLDSAGATGRPFLRLYRFAPSCLSLGRNQPTARSDRAAIARLGCDVVRRPTGGGAVWHEHDVTYAVAAPIAVFGGLRAAYGAIQARLAAALRALGVEAVLAPDRASGRRPDWTGSCFATAVGGEVVVGGRKLIGSAQVRHGHAFLQHGSILLDGSQEIVRLVSGEAGGGETTLRSLLGRPVAFAEVASAIVDSWGVTRPLTARPADGLTAAFRDPTWTWRR
jgi:lipoyl(octanoyl) transferase